jgi:beta-RFAP synthase
MKSLWLNVGGRLHLGQLDLCGSLGRIYGGLGLAIDAPQIKLTAGRHADIYLRAPDQDTERRLRHIASAFLEHYGLPGIEINLEEALPSHSGLGSSSQMALAVGLAITEVYGVQAPLTELALVTEREGSRSGIGVATFELGGFAVDGGKSSTAGPGGANNSPEVPPLVAHMPFPEHWRIILALPETPKENIHGLQEQAAFAALEPMSAELSGQLCRSLLMNVLPALKLHDLALFGRGVSAIQNAAGDYFAPVQGGRYHSRLCQEVAQFLMEHGVVGVGQSSWGPAIYGFTDAKRAADLQRRMEAFLTGRGRVWQAKGRNYGAVWGWHE